VDRIHEEIKKRLVPCVKVFGPRR